MKICRTHPMFGERPSSGPAMLASQTVENGRAARQVTSLRPRTAAVRPQCSDSRRPLESIPRQRGFSLIECLVYIGCVAVVLAVGSAALYRCWDDNLAITRNADDIVRTLRAGEAWRADIRSTTGLIKITSNASGQNLVMPCGTNELTYSFSGGEVRKRMGRNSSWILVLPKVKSSQMQLDPRNHVAAWRWEVALESRRKNVHFRPLFTFEAVAGNSRIQ